MALWERQFYYKIEEVDGETREMDYLTSNLYKMNLETAEYHMVDSVTENRPDLISMKYFGTYHFGWLIGMHNDIEDLTMGFPIGLKIGIPSMDEYYRFYNRNTRTQDERI